MKRLLYIFGGSKVEAPRIGCGSLVFPGGPNDRERFGPPHICVPPHVEAAKALGATYGAIWRCDCGKQHRLVWDSQAGTDGWQQYNAETALREAFVDVTSRPGQ